MVRHEELSWVAEAGDAGSLRPCELHFLTQVNWWLPGRRGMVAPVRERSLELSLRNRQRTLASRRASGVVDLPREGRPSRLSPSLRGVALRRRGRTDFLPAGRHERIPDLANLGDTAPQEPVIDVRTGSARSGG